MCNDDSVRNDPIFIACPLNGEPATIILSKLSEQEFELSCSNKAFPECANECKLAGPVTYTKIFENEES